MTYIEPEETVFGVGLLERLTVNSKFVSLTRGADLNDVLDSIKLNVSNILNTRVGGTQCAPALGLVDFNDATLESMDLSVRIMQAIQHCIECYEPRLKDVLVLSDRESFSSMTLRFHITASINNELLNEQVRFSLLLDNNRKYRVF